jgi:CRP-like cAMP-binding protein
MDTQYAAMIAEFPLFQGFTVQGAQRLLERGEVKEYIAGEVIFREGDPPTSVMVVLAGKIQVFVQREGEDIILTDVHPGGVLGELAVLCGMPRSASLRASEQAVVLLWSAAAFRNLLLRYALLSERIFRESLRTLIDKERSLIDSLAASRNHDKQIDHENSG